MPELANRSTGIAAPEPDQDPEPDPPMVTPTTPVEPASADPEESNRLLTTVYEEIGVLAAAVGVAHTDGSYGGTGFAYDVFNRLIGAEDRADREGLVAQCEALLDQVSAPRAELEAANVAAAYRDQQQALISLGRLLERRVQVLLDTARVAVDNPSEESWRPVLSPLSTELREQFDHDYPLARPSRQ
jgi:hypothetical protein